MTLSLRTAIVAALCCLPAGLLQAQDHRNQFTSWGPTHPGMMHAWNYPGSSAPPYGGWLDAGLYPSPKPDIPYEVGTTIITNPAFDPHEMLYPHVYRGVYPPFYFKKGKFTNSGHMIGTEVRVKYHGHYRLFSGFFPPRRPPCN